MRQAASPSRFRMDRHELFILQRKQSSFRLRLSIELRPQGDRRTCRDRLASHKRTYASDGVAELAQLFKLSLEYKSLGQEIAHDH